MKTYLWDVDVYRRAGEGQLPMEFLMSGQVEAPHKQKAAITMFKKVRELFGKDIEVDMVVRRRVKKMTLIDWMMEHPYLSTICFLGFCDALAAIARALK